MHLFQPTISRISTSLRCTLLTKRTRTTTISPLRTTSSRVVTKAFTSVEPAMSSCRRRLADRWLAILSAIREQRPSTQRKKPMRKSLATPSKTTPPTSRTSMVSTSMVRDRYRLRAISSILTPRITPAPSTYAPSLPQLRHRQASSTTLSSPTQATTVPMVSRWEESLKMSTWRTIRFVLREQRPRDPCSGRTIT